MWRRRGLRGVFVLAAFGALLAGCAETELVTHTAKVIGRDGRPQPSAPVPEGYKLGAPYEVFGVTYYPYHDPRFSEQGIASWYGDEFHGRKTASGEPFDMNALTAAHKTLPLPSTARVTNLENGRSLFVRVNDRGPFVNGRVIDLSRRSAQLLGIYGTGTAKVRVDFLDFAPLYVPTTVMARRVDAPAPPPPPRRNKGAAAGPLEAANAKTPTPSKIEVEQINGAAPQVAAAAPKPPKKRRFELIASAEAAESDAVVLAASAERSDMFVQVGAFASRENADRLRGLLATMGRPLVDQANRNGQILYRVRFGPIASLDDADSLLDRLIKSGYKSARLVVETE